MTQTLRFRLLVWNALVVALTALVTLLGMQFGVRKALLHEIDQFLLDGLKELCPLVESTPIVKLPVANGAPNAVHLHFGQRLATVFDRSGKSLWSSSGAGLRLGPNGHNDVPTSVDDYRIVQRQVRAVDGKSVIAQVAIPLSVIDADIDRVDALAMSYAATLLVVAPLVGYWLAGRVVSPLQALISQTAHLRPGKLGHRLQLRNTGDELDQLAGTINDLLDRIASYLTHREDFVANAAHELRNPVAAIRSMAEVTLASPRSNEEHEQVLEEMIQECARLESLVTQLLLLSESDADRLKVHEERLDLSQIVERAMAMFGPAAESLGISVNSSSRPAMIRGNPHHLQQLVSNLFDNALKFTPPQGRIGVSVEVDQDKGQAVLMVSDSGGGIPADEIQHVFERFYRGEQARFVEGGGRGAGLGLSICKSIVGAHRGTIEVQSAPHVGTTFTVRLPLAPGGEIHVTPAAATP